MTGTTARSQDCTNNNDNGGIIAMKYPENIMRMVRESFDLEPDDTNCDGEIDLMTNREIFEAICNYEGLIGYADTIIGWINQIYGVDLNGEE